MSLIFCILLLTPAVHVYENQEALQMTCALLDSVPGAWYSTDNTFTESVVASFPDFPLCSTSPYRQSITGIDVRFENSMFLSSIQGNSTVELLSAYLSRPWTYMASPEAWRVVYLKGDSLLITRQGIDQERIPLDNGSDFISFSTDGNFALVYFVPESANMPASLVTVDLTNGNIRPFNIDDPGFMSSGRFDCFVSNSGCVYLKRFFTGPVLFVPDSSLSGVVIELPDTDGRLGTLTSASTSEYSTGVFPGECGLPEIELFDHEGSVVSRVTPFRQYPMASFPSDGRTIAVSSELGVSVFDVHTGEMVSECIYGSANSPAVISSSGLYWACTFNHSLFHPQRGFSIVSGFLDGSGPAVVQFTDTSDFWSAPEVLSLSDRGDVLCRVNLDVPYQPESVIRYFLVDSTGSPVWISEPYFPSAGYVIPAENVRGPYISVMPRLADMSSDGNMVLLFDYETVRLLILDQD